MRGRQRHVTGRRALCSPRRSPQAMKRGGGAKARAAAEPFGWDYTLFRSLRNTYHKFSFGTQPVQHLELQSEFVCVHKIPLR